MQYWKAEAPAKINLSLDVLERLPNGYHRLAMIMQTVGLTDTVEISTCPAGISLVCEREGVGDNPADLGETTGCGEIPSDARNLAWKAADVFFRHHPGGGAEIRLIKRIPVAAGLAGGSSDAAAVLQGLNTLYDKPFSQEALEKMGISLGADVPYCLRGGTCFAEGIGEVLTVLPDFSGRWLVLVKPPFPVSTPWVFSRLNMGHLGERPDTMRLLERVHAGDTEGVARGMRNVLEQVTVSAYPEIERLRRQLLALGALGSRMSGSGPSVFGLFADEAKARSARVELKADWPDSWVVPTVGGWYLS